jgi:hypothetical protein
VRNIEDVFFFSELQSPDIYKCLWWYKQNSTTAFAGNTFFTYSQKLDNPRLARSLMRGFIDVPAEQKSTEEKTAQREALAQAEVREVIRRFKGKIIFPRDPSEARHQGYK